MLIIAILVMVQARKFINKRQKSWENRSNVNIPSKNNKNMVSVEEIYYYKGKTNQQLLQYNEALQCYSKALKLNPDFEPAKNAKEEVLKFIEN
jgi:tetratricopeptide (TPR) repeat protein